MRVDSCHLIRVIFAESPHNRSVIQNTMRYKTIPVRFSPSRSYIKKEYGYNITDEALELLVECGEDMMERMFEEASICRLAEGSGVIMGKHIRLAARVMRIENQNS